MSRDAEIGRLTRSGDGVMCWINRPLREALGWNVGDRIAMRPCGNQLVLQRIPMEQLALLRRNQNNEPTAP